VRNTIEVLSPVGERPKIELRRSDPLLSLEGKVAGLLGNNKSNSADFLRQMGAALKVHYGVREVVHTRKPGAASPASPEVWDQLKGCDFLVTAFAD